MSAYLEVELGVGAEHVDLVHGRHGSAHLQKTHHHTHRQSKEAFEHAQQEMRASRQRLVGQWRLAVVHTSSVTIGECPRPEGHVSSSGAESSVPRFTCRYSAAPP
jgi:hypothetical protein